MTNDPLALDAETMRKLGYQAVDMLVDRLTDPSIPPLRRATPQEMAKRLSGPPPEEPQEWDEILRRLDEDVLPFMSKGDHPGFFAYVPFAGTWPGALGDLIASATNVYAGSWMEAAGPSQVELEVIGWFKDWLGYPEEAAGLLVSGGSAANLAALACAREAQVGSMSDDLVVYVSDQAHSSVARAARALGFRQNQVRVIPTGAELEMRVDLLQSAMEADVAAGRKPLFVSANGGATNSGAVDPLEDLVELCERAGRVAARGRGVRRVRGARRARAAAARRDRGRGLDHARPAQVALPAVRVRLPARPRRRRAAERVHDHARLPEGSGRGRQRGQLLRPRPAADQDGARVQGLVLDPVLRARRVPARDRADVRALRARGDADQGQRPARARGAAVPRDRQLPPAFRRETRTC